MNPPRTFSPSTSTPRRRQSAAINGGARRQFHPNPMYKTTPRLPQITKKNTHLRLVQRLFAIKLVFFCS